MNSEHPKPKAIESPIESDNEAVGFDEFDDSYEYTSLKDVMQSGGSSVSEGGSMFEFDTSTISIRNELVKHAASAYVQSTAILVNRDRDYWFAEAWSKLKNNVFRFTSCWHVHVGIPFHAFFSAMLRFLDFFLNTIAKVFTERTTQ